VATSLSSGGQPLLLPLPALGLPLRLGPAPGAWGRQRLLPDLTQGFHRAFDTTHKRFVELLTVSSWLGDLAVLRPDG
jgi:hypothetical protein